MSAWRVSKADIDGIIQYAMSEGLLDIDKRNDMGIRLDVENQLSLQARYGDPLQDSEYSFSGIEAPLDDLKMVKHIGCYWYQTCEHSTWDRDDNEVRLFVERVRLHAIHKQGYESWDHWYEAKGGSSEYNDAPWGVSKIEELV